MALETIPEGLELEEVESKFEVMKENAETDVTIENAGEQMLEEKVAEPLLGPLTNPWDSNVCDGECDRAMMAAAKVSPQVSKDLYLDKCIIAFANIKDVNENLRNKILNDKVQFEKTFKELKSKLFEKENEISSLKHESNITKDQLQTMVEKYQSCKKELESTQITCEKWVESCKGYELMLEKQIKSNVKFGIGFRKMTKFLKTLL
ncbi:hypothetical protein Hanom_Chr10g00929411 [Helianthus anomalus]